MAKVILLALLLSTLQPWSRFEDEEFKLKVIQEYMERKGCNEEKVDLFLMTYGLEHDLQVTQCHYCDDIISVINKKPFGLIVFGQVCERCDNRALDDIKKWNSDRHDINLRRNLANGMA